MNDNNEIILPRADDSDLPAEFQGRVTVIVEFCEMGAMNINGLEMTLSDGVALLRKLTNGEIKL